MTELNAKKRIYWLDAARVTAIISISLNHAVNRSYDNYIDQMSEFLAIPFASTIFKAVISVFSRLGVPLFLMISGALLLKKDITDEQGFKRFYLYNYLDLLITSEIWYFIMFWIVSIGKLFMTGESPLLQVPILLWGCVKTMLFIDQVTFESMWYIPMILAVYLLIPVFALVFRKVSLRVIAIPCIVVFFSTMLIPNVNAFLSLSGSDTNIAFALRSSNIFSGYFLYVFAGYWISQGGLDGLKSGAVALLALATFAILCALQLYAYSRPDNYLISYDFSLILFCSMFLFEWIRRCKDRQGKFAKFVAYLSKISFGIYFVHIIIMTLINKLPFYSGWPRPIYLLFLEIVSVGGSVVFIWVFSHIDIFKRRLFLIKD